MKNIYGYDYKRKTRSSKYGVFLSNQDDGIPKTHIGMYEILRNPENKSFYMSEQQCQITRKKTFDGVHEIYKKYGSPSYSDLWNYNIKAITDLGMNYFSVNPNLLPISYIIQCFELKTEKGQFAQRKVSFGIHREVFKKYLQDLEKSQKNGEPIKVPSLKPTVPKTKAQVIFGEEQIKIDDEHTVSLDRNAAYNQFDSWCKLQGVEQKEGLVMALQTLVKAYPIKGLYDLEYYNVVTELDKQVFLPEDPEEHKIQRINIGISSFLYNKAKNIITRYNLDPKNLVRGELDFDTYVNNALYHFNNKMPMKYQNPDFLSEKETIDKMEESI